MTDHTRQAPLIDDVRRVTASELSLSARTGYVGLLLVAAAMTVVVSALLVTEPALPLRASIALGVLAAIGLSWVSFAAWVLTNRRVLFGRHRVVAGRMAVGFSVRVLRRCAGRGICDVEPERVRRRRHGRTHDRDSDWDIGAGQAQGRAAVETA